MIAIYKLPNLIGLIKFINVVYLKVTLHFTTMHLNFIEKIIYM